MLGITFVFLFLSLIPYDPPDLDRPRLSFSRSRSSLTLSRKPSLTNISQYLGVRLTCSLSLFLACQLARFLAFLPLSACLLFLSQLY